jgi:hypothetical protein
MGSRQRRGPEQATCVHTAGFEDVHRGERAARIP